MTYVDMVAAVDDGVGVWREVDEFVEWSKIAVTTVVLVTRSLLRSTTTTPAQQQQQQQQNQYGEKWKQHFCVNIKQIDAMTDYTDLLMFDISTCKTL